MTSLTRVLVINGSPKKDGNTAMLCRWFSEGAQAAGAEVSVVCAAGITLKAGGCVSCRACQSRREYGCVIADEASEIIVRMLDADSIVLATPLYFFAMSSQLKVIVDRMFSLYKWDNAAATMETPLRGKTLVVLASAYEAIGLEELAAPLRLTAAYTGMKFESLLVPDAGVSGSITGIPGIREKAAALGAAIARGGILSGPA